MLSSVISSQIEKHRPFGGVVPELASREHLDKIQPIVEKALADAGVSLKDLDAVAVTQGPGLVGSLLVAPFFVGDSSAPRFVSDGHFPWNAGRRATLAEVRQIGDVVLLRYALSRRFRDE